MLQELGWVGLGLLAEKVLRKSDKYADLTDKPIKMVESVANSLLNTVKGLGKDRKVAKAGREYLKGLPEDEKAVNVSEMEAIELSGGKGQVHKMHVCIGLALKKTEERDYETIAEIASELFSAIVIAQAADLSATAS